MRGGLRQSGNFPELFLAPEMQAQRDLPHRRADRNLGISLVSTDLGMLASHVLDLPVPPLQPHEQIPHCLFVNAPAQVFIERRKRLRETLGRDGPQKTLTHRFGRRNEDLRVASGGDHSGHHDDG